MIVTYDLAMAMHADRLPEAAARRRHHIRGDAVAHLRTQIACLIVRSVHLGRHLTPRDRLVAAACGCQ